jgi:hypothetical protein
MPIVSRSLRALATAPILLALLLAALPTPAAALEPPRPLPHYRPPFVTETDERPMNDCLWASAAMLINKWTNGKIHPTHQRLRSLSGDRYRGSYFDDLKIAYRKLGINLRFSPDGGDRITFSGLLRRLAHGAGAVVLGDYSQLPSWYGRWDYAFWHMTKTERKKHRSADNHAVYVERFDRRRGRVWLMDPLAHGKWRGEWISIWSLRRFAWSRGGALYTAVTPKAKPAPFAHVRTSKAALSRTSSVLQASWSFRAHRRWRFPGVTTRTAFVTASDPLLALAKAPRLDERVTDDSAPSHTLVAASRRSLSVKAPLPAKSGAYLGSFRLTDRRFGRTVSQVGGVPVFVPGDRRATLSLSTPEPAVEAGKGLDISISVINSGEVTWADPSDPSDPSDPDPEPRRTRLLARWIPLDIAAKQAPARVGGSTGDAVPAPVALKAVPLGTGEQVFVDTAVRAPAALGRWVLAVDVVDDVSGSYAKLGSRPAILYLDVVAPRSRTSVS